MTSPTQIASLYFSGTGTTKTIVDAIATGLAGDSFSGERKTYDVLASDPGEIVVPPYGGVTVVGMPVYAGRIPFLARERLEMFSGNDTPAIAVAVYGNRAYDDALLELVDTLSGNGFKVFAAAAFIGEHSIFHKVAAGRPDAADMTKVASFTNKCADLLASGLFDAAPVKVPGKRPYVTPGKSVGLQPLVDASTCTRCGACVKVCPTKALSFDGEGKGVIKDLGLCIPCSACIKVCPTGSQAYRGQGYETYSKIFEEKNAKRCEPEFFYL